MVDEREETGVRGVGWVTGRGAREEASQGGEGQLREAASEGNVLVTKRGHRGCLCVEVSAEGGRMIEEEERDRRTIGEEGREKGGGGGREIERTVIILYPTHCNRQLACQVL